MTTDEMRAALAQARIQAYDAKQRGDLKRESDWLETARFWRAKLAAANPMGIPA
jgi:hypothetical protein